MDNWKHRSQEMKCQTCIWFVPKAASETPLDPNAKSKQQVERGRIGRCRRHAPTMAGFPVVFESDWCGDHKLTENV